MHKGETLKLTVTDADASGVEFRFGGAETKTETAANDSGDWSISAATSTWAPGRYAWQAWATYADNSVAVTASGNFDLEAALGVGEVRTTARQMVEMIEAQMKGNAPEAVRRYRINNRELERYSVAELLSLLSYWKGQLKTEERKEKGMSALGPRIAVRF
jgi:hypothetical protein